MAVLTDEILMAYADGALDKEMRARVEALLHQDAGSRRRVEIFRATGTRMSSLFDETLHQPVPSQLVDFVLQYGKSGATVPPKQRRFADMLGAWTEKLWQAQSGLSRSWQFAAASAAVLVIGASAGWLIHGEAADGTPSAPQLAFLKDGQIVASGAFKQILETAPSNREIRVAGSSQDSTVMRPSLTFKNRLGGYCREYEITSGEGRFAGLACRTTSGNWTVQVHVAEAKPATPGSQYGPAGHETALEPIVTNLIEGDALGKTEEEETISNGWK